jgi:hypothetical protein
MLRPFCRGTLASSSHHNLPKSGGGTHFHHAQDAKNYACELLSSLTWWVHPDPLPLRRPLKAHKGEGRESTM